MSLGRKPLNFSTPADETIAVLPATDDQPPAILIEVAVPANLALNLQLKAGPNVSLGQHLIDLATRFADLPLYDFKGMWLSGNTKGAIEKIVGAGFSTEGKLLELLEHGRALVLTGPVRVMVPDDVLELLRSRFYGNAEDYDQDAELLKLVELMFDRFRFGQM